MLLDNWKKFADAHILDKEIDPLYDFLYEARHDKGELWAHRFALHLLMFYDVGGAVKCADATDNLNFWGYVNKGYKDFPRGTNRRHSHGIVGEAYLYNLSQRGTPEEIIEGMYAPTYPELVKKIGKDYAGCGFGPYFIWKIMDLQDRVFGRPVHLDMEAALKYLPDEPRKGAKLVWEDRTLREVLSGMVAHISSWTAPGCPNRVCGLPEAESLLCALRGYVKGTYHHGKDLEERHRQLAGFPDLIKYLPPIPKGHYERPVVLDPAILSAHLA